MQPKNSEEPNHSSPSTACRFRTAQTTRRDVSKLIKMFDGIYQHFKKLSSQRISHIRHLEKEEWVCYGESSIFKLMQFRTAIHRCLCINNTFDLSNLMSFTWPRVSDKRLTVKNIIPLFLKTVNFSLRNAREWMDPQMHLRVSRWLVENWRPVK